MASHKGQCMSRSSIWVPGFKNSVEMSYAIALIPSHKRISESPTFELSTNMARGVYVRVTVKKLSCDSDVEMNSLICMIDCKRQIVLNLDNSLLGPLIFLLDYFYFCHDPFCRAVLPICRSITSQKCEDLGESALLKSTLTSAMTSLLASTAQLTCEESESKILEQGRIGSVLTQRK